MPSALRNTIVTAPIPPGGSLETAREMQLVHATIIPETALAPLPFADNP
jgi:hypothetical protein